MTDAIRTFDTGASRDQDADKLDFEGFLSPLVIQAYGEYMHENRVMADGTLRASDNWQKGIPLDAYMQSGWRHFHDWWMEHRGYDSREGMKKAILGLIFNAMGYLHVLLRQEAQAELADAQQIMRDFWQEKPIFPNPLWTCAAGIESHSGVGMIPCSCVTPPTNPNTPY